MALSRDIVRDYFHSDNYAVPLDPQYEFYVGGFVGSDPAGSGAARPLQAGDDFLGIVDYVDTVRGVLIVRVMALVKLIVPLLDIEAAMKKPFVYAVDDNTFTLTSSGNTLVGFVEYFLENDLAFVRLRSKVSAVQAVLEPNSVSSTELTESPPAVETDNIKNLAVTTIKLSNAPNGITGDKINNLAVDTDQIANLAVTTDKLSSKIGGTAAVSFSRIQDGAVRTDELANLAVTTGKLSSKIGGTAAVSTNRIQDGAVTEDELSSTVSYTTRIIGQAVYSFDFGVLSLNPIQAITVPVSFDPLTDFISAVTVFDDAATGQAEHVAGVTFESELSGLPDGVSQNIVFDRTPTVSDFMQVMITVYRPVPVPFTP